MDAEQVRLDLNATRRRLDEQLDALEARTSRAHVDTLRMAAATMSAGAALAILLSILRRRHPA